MDQQFQPQPLRRFIPETDHFPELPGRIDMQQRKGWFAGIERLQGQMQHDRRVFADGVQHHRFFKLGGHLADNVDTLGFELLEMRQFSQIHGA